MNTRRTGVMTALLLTAALFLAMPGILRVFQTGDANRMDERLRPPRMRTVTVWLMPGRTGDAGLISQACAAFEKAHPGVRIFLRVADAQELYGEDAVLPDAVLFDTGSVNLPEKAFLPLAGGTESSAMQAGASYALPLWLSPSVLSLPQSWLSDDARKEPSSPSLLAAAPPVSEERREVIGAADVPWERLSEPGALSCPDGVALQQLMCMSPVRLSGALSAPYQEIHAQVVPLRDHLKSIREGKMVAACLLTPAVCDRVRYAALCRDGQDARDWLAFLQEGMASKTLDAGFIPLQPQGASAEGITQAALELFSGVHTLPNAFAHTRSELEQLCREGFERAQDPVETLLRLR